MKMKLSKMFLVMFGLGLFMVFVAPVLASAENLSLGENPLLGGEIIEPENLHEVLEHLPNDSLISKNFETGELSISLYSVSEVFDTETGIGARNARGFSGASPTLPTLEWQEEWLELEDNPEMMEALPEDVSMSLHISELLERENTLQTNDFFHNFEFRDNFQINSRFNRDFNSSYYPLTDYSSIQELNSFPFLPISDIAGLIGMRDERVRINPQNPALAHLTMQWRDGSLGRCSAFVVGPRVLVTSGHCLYTHREGREGFITGLRVEPGRYGDTFPFGTFNPVSIEVHGGWIQHESFDYDIAIIIVNGDIGARTGTFGWDTTAPQPNTVLRPSGYPLRVQGRNNAREQWAMMGLPHGVSRYLIHHPLDVTGGQSGGPVTLGASNTVVGVNAGNVRWFADEAHTLLLFEENQATRITPEFSNLLHQLRFLR